jgi:hypothetical protein
LGFVLLLKLGSDADMFGVAYAYFADYVSVTALVMEQIDRQGMTYGAATVSSFWYFVPRAMFPDKPFEYGSVLLHGTLFPGFAEQGHTPGVLPWMTGYMDFGIFGVVLSGVFLGSVSRAIYLEFLRTKDAGTFLLMVSFCFIAPVSSGSSVIFFMMALFLWRVNGKRGNGAALTRHLNTNAGTLHMNKKFPIAQSSESKTS